MAKVLRDTFNLLPEHHEQNNNHREVDETKRVRRLAAGVRPPGQMWGERGGGGNSQMTQHNWLKQSLVKEDTKIEQTGTGHDSRAQNRKEQEKP